MEGNNELTRAQLLASPPMKLEDVDAWLEKYNAVINAARAEALRVERLRDAAPDLVHELAAAEKIILAMLNVMTPEQKAQAAAKLEADGVSGEGMTRYHERRTALTKAGVTA